MSRKTASAPAIDDLTETLERVAIADLRPHPRNYLAHPPAQLDHLRQSIDEHGIYRNVVIARDGTLLAGHGVVQAAQQQGYTHVSVKRLDVDPDSDQALKVLVGDNELARLRLADDALLVELLQDLSRDDPAMLLGTGFDEAALEALMTQQGLEADGADHAGRDVEPQIDRAEELRQEWGVELGQLWACGQHRVICGDCTDKSVVERLMQGNTASLCVTSPPYWVGKGYEREHTWDDIQAFILRFTACVTLAVSHRIVINTGAPPAARLTGERPHVRLLLDEYQAHLASHGFLLRYVRIWAKRGGLVHVAPQADCIDQHWEFIGVFYHPDRFEGQRRCGESWATDGLWDDIVGTMSAHDHVAAFPLDIPARNIRLYTDPGGYVYDPFLGSGTTLIACENLRRVCYGCELAPGYVAVTLQRWHDLTGQTPERVS